MAKQEGLVKFRGTIEDVSFYKTKRGYLARKHGGIEKGRIESDPVFQRTRENGAEFGRAGIAGQILRKAFKSLLEKNADREVVSRLTKEMMKVVHSDKASRRGERNVSDGDLSLLQGFEFNLNAQMNTVLFVPYRASIDRSTGEGEVTIPALVPEGDIELPQGATHYKFISAGAEIDFVSGDFKMVRSMSPEIEIGPEEQPAVTLTNALPAASTLPLFLVLGIEFYQQVNGVFYPLKGESHNSLTLVSVSLPVAG
ncbi:MAG: hypothetical protein ABFD10_22040 [Prolixibacteraceae bacterium]